MLLSNPYETTPLRDITGDCLRPGGLALTRHGLSLCDLPPGSRILDLGCGPGASLRLLSEIGYAAMGLDQSVALTREAHRHAPCLRADMAVLPFADSCLDGITCECVLSLATDKERVLRECVRVLRGNGRMLLCDIIREDPAETGGDVPCIRGAVTREQLCELLERAGFAIITMEDHSRALRELAAQIVWRFGSMDAFTALWQCGENSPCGSGLKPKLSYILAVLRKR